MLELMKKPTMGKYVDIQLRVPVKDAAKVFTATKEFLKLAGHEVREINERGEALYSGSEVFPDSRPGRILRGLRVREDMTQKCLAEKAGLRPHHISEMEHGKRPIGKETARRLAGVLGADYRMLL